jgi:hypothetical protein
MNDPCVQIETGNWQRPALVIPLFIMKYRSNVQVAPHEVIFCRSCNIVCQRDLTTKKNHDAAHTILRHVQCYATLTGFGKDPLERVRLI